MRDIRQNLFFADDCERRDDVFVRLGHCQRPQIEAGHAVTRRPGHSGASRYTGRVSWRSRVALFALTVFTALPMAGTLCAVVCDSTASTPSHHASKKDCDEPAIPSTTAQFRETVDHDCSAHGDAIGPTVATAAGRADLDVTSNPPLTVAGPPTSPLSRNGGSEFRPRPLTDQTPPGSASLVLRV